MAVVSIAPLPFPPDTYDHRYFNETIRTLNLHFRQLQTPGPVVGDTLQLLNVATNPGSGPVGKVWLDKSQNVLRIVDDTYVFLLLSGQSSAFSTGTITP